MKRAMPWSDHVNVLSSDESSSDSDSEADDGSDKTKPTSKSTNGQPAKEVRSEVRHGKQKGNVIDFEALRRHGYRGGLSVLNMPPPKMMDVREKDWSWSTGKESSADKKAEESYEERRRTRNAITEGEKLMDAQTTKEKKNFSFSQKEKRKRELGQASRGKNYVEEEKRVLRENGVYSGFDS